MGIEFLGPTLRGLFGYALREAACGHPSDADGYCTQPLGCPYSRIFEGLESLPQPFVLLVDPPKRRSKRMQIRCGVRLFGAAMHDAPLVVRAFEIGESCGIGSDRIHYRLTSSLVKAPTPSHSQRTLDPSNTRALEWVFRTPLSLREGDDLRANPTGDDIVAAGRRRVCLIRAASGAQGDSPTPIAPPRGSFRIVKKHIREWRIFRTSGRQGRAVPLRGIIGRMVIEGPWFEEAWWLNEIESTHLGKHTSFGLGSATWQQLPARGGWLRLPRWIRLRGFPPPKRCQWSE